MSDSVTKLEAATERTLNLLKQYSDRVKELEDENQSLRDELAIARDEANQAYYYTIELQNQLAWAESEEAEMQAQYHEHNYKGRC